MRPSNNKLKLLGGELEVERTPHHTDIRFRLKKGLAGTAVASGGKRPPKPSATLVKPHYVDRVGTDDEDDEDDFVNIEDLRRQIGLRNRPRRPPRSSSLPENREPDGHYGQLANYQELNANHVRYGDMARYRAGAPIQRRRADDPLPEAPPEPEYENIYDAVAPRRRSRLRRAIRNRCSIQ